MDGREGIQRGIIQVLGVINIFDILIVVMFSQMYTNVKYCQTVHLKDMQFIVYQLFLNKTFKKILESATFLLVYYHHPGERIIISFLALYNSLTLSSLSPLVHSLHRSQSDLLRT